MSTSEPPPQTQQVEVTIPADFDSREGSQSHSSRSWGIEDELLCLPLNDVEHRKKDTPPLTPVKRESNHMSVSWRTDTDDDSEFEGTHSFASIMHSSMNSIATFESIPEAFDEDGGESAAVSCGTHDDDLSQELESVESDLVDQEGIDSMLEQVESMLEAAVMTTIRAKFKQYRESNGKLKGEQAALNLVMTKMKTRIESLEEDTEQLTEKLQSKQATILQLKEELDLQNEKVEMLQDMLKWRGPTEERKFSWKLPSFGAVQPMGSLNSKLPPASSSSNPQTDEAPTLVSRLSGGSGSGTGNPSSSFTPQSLEKRDSKIEILQKMVAGGSNRKAPGRSRSWVRQAPMATMSWSAGQKINSNKIPQHNLAACNDHEGEHVLTTHTIDPDESLNNGDDDAVTKDAGGVSEGHKQNLLL